MVLALSWPPRPPTPHPPQSKKCFKEANTVDRGTKFIIRDTVQHMGEHTDKQFIYLSQKQDRNTYSEKKGMGILSDEEEHSKEVIFIFIFKGFHFPS